MSSLVETSVKVVSSGVDALKINDGKVPPPNSLRRPIAVRPTVLMGAGPTNPTQRVTEAMSKPQMGIHSAEIHQVS